MGIQSNYFIKMNTSEKCCNVCGDKALGYNFNAITCESCKAFFRRNALSKKEFTCPFNQKCEINVVTRRFCQRCRLEKCFTIGMRKEYIMSEEDKMLKRKKIEMNRLKRKLNGEQPGNAKKLRRDETFAPAHQYASNNHNNWGSRENSIDFNYIGSPDMFMNNNDSPTLRRPSPVSPHTFDLSSRLQSTMHFPAPQFTFPNVEYHSAFIPSSPASSVGTLSPRFEPRPYPNKESSASDIVKFIIENPSKAANFIDRIMPTPATAIEIITKILNSQKDAMDLVGYLIGSPMDGLKIISKIMNSPFNALAVFSKFVSSPTDSLEFIAKIVNSPAEVLQFVRQLMTSPEDAIDIINKFMDSPAEALKMLSDMVNTTITPNIRTHSHHSASSHSEAGDDHSSCISGSDISTAIKIGNLNNMSPLNTEFRPFASPFHSLANPAVRNYFDAIQCEPIHSFIDLTSPTLPRQKMASPYDVPKVHSPVLSEQFRMSPSLYSMPDGSQQEDEKFIKPAKGSPQMVSCFNNTLESAIAEAIHMEYDVTSKSQESTKSRDLNESENAKLNELIVANKALYMPVEEDLSSLASNEADNTLTKTFQYPIFEQSRMFKQKREKNPEDPQLLTLINLTAIAIKRLIKMAKKINSFKNMCQEDQVALLKGGCTEMMILRSIMQYDVDHSTWKIPQNHDGSMTSIKTDLLKLANNNVYEEYENFIRTFDAKLRKDENVILIMSAIVLFTPSRPMTVHADVLKLEQNSYYYLLRRYLESIYSGCEAKSLYLKMIQKINELKQLKEVIIAVYLDANPSQVEPLLREIFDLKI